LRPRHSLLFPALLLWAAAVFGAETPIPESPTQWVTDTANFLSPQTVSSLNARLSAYQRASGHQLIVYIAPTTGDAPIEDWAVRAFAKWKVGRKGLDDGLALFIMPQDRKLRIEVGYGLEPVVPDAIASRIINEVMVPRIQAGQRDEAVTAGVDSLIRVIGGDSTALPQEAPAPARRMSAAQAIFWGIVGILFLGFLITHPTLALFFLTSILSGGGGRGRGGGFGWGGGGFGGGFGGGGGRSGGGGASGSW
jgi:uncharacterized protein